MKKTNRVFLTRALSALALLLSALASTLPAAPQASRELAPLPVPRAAQASGGSWTQTQWLTPTTTLATAPSGTGLFFRPASLPNYGQFIGSFNVCAGPGAWCQGPGDSAPGQTVRMAGNHKGDAGNFYSSDLNGDGISELLVANLSGPNGGWIYWGQGTPTNPIWSESARTDLPTASTYHAVSADLNGDGLPEVIFGGYTDASESYIYWGQPGGTYGVQYSGAARTALGPGRVLGVAVAHLNDDGRPEVILVRHYYVDTYNVNSYVYWGQAGGPYGVQYSAANSGLTQLPTTGGWAVAVADLNSDGRPELIFAGFQMPTRIYWGQPDATYGVGYSTATNAFTDLPSSSNAFGIAVADLNADGRPEIVVAIGNQGFVYWGTPGGPQGTTYNLTDRTTLPAPAAFPASVADLNSDNQPDVVIQGASGGPISNGSYTRVFWGPLPVGVTALVSWTVGHQFTNFYGLNLSDLDSDGRPDLFIARDIASSSTGARVYFHGGDNAAPYGVIPAFDLPVNRAQSVYASLGASRGTSNRLFSQPRSIYGTTYPISGVVESMVIDSGQNGTAWHTVFATTSITAGTGITLFMAASNNISALTTPGWVQVGAMGNGSWTQTVSGVSGRYARYRAVLWRSRTTEASPALQQITINYGTLPGSFNKSAPSPSGVTGVATTPTLSWTAAADAAHYEVCHDTNVNGTCNGAWQNVGNVLSTTLSGLALGTQYEWQVRACNIAGCNGGADGGAWWTFTVQSAIGNVDTSGPLGTRKEAAPTVVRMGALVSYTIVLSNSGGAAATVRVTDTLAVSATLVGATPGYSQAGQTLVWSGVNVPAGGTTVLTITARAGSGPLPEGYFLFNTVVIGAVDGEIVRAAPLVEVEPRRAYLPLVRRP